MKRELFFLLSFLATVPLAHAAVSLDRTRVIYQENMKSVSLTIKNNNNKLPYLAQAWIDDAYGKKLDIPFVTLPPLQRVEPGMESLVKIQALPIVRKLPKDRESLFYFNLREIPPRSDKPNVLQLALQTRIKFFYRPESLVVESGSNVVAWQENMKLKVRRDSVEFINPTPYFISIVDAQQSGRIVTGFEPIMISPLSTKVLALKFGGNPRITYVDDYGGRRDLKYICPAIGDCKINTDKSPSNN